MICAAGAAGAAGRVRGANWQVMQVAAAGVAAHARECTNATHAQPQPHACKHMQARLRGCTAGAGARAGAAPGRGRTRLIKQALPPLLVQLGGVVNGHGHLQKQTSYKYILGPCTACNQAVWLGVVASDVCRMLGGRGAAPRNRRSSREEPSREARAGAGQARSETHAHAAGHRQRSAPASSRRAQPPGTASLPAACLRGGAAHGRGWSAWPAGVWQQHIALGR